MLRQAPPLEAIEIFVAAAGGASFRSVARELALSPSAVSRRIAALEAFLGTSLFERRGQTQRLSPAGTRYLAAVEPALHAIRRATAQVSPDPLERLTVATSHSLAAAWLVPRLPEAQDLLGIEIEVLPSRNPDVLRSGEAQLAIWGGMSEQPGLAAERLFDVVAIPAARPQLVGRKGWSDAELAVRPLLTVQSPSRLWERWFAGEGESAPCPLRLRVFPTLQLMYEAACAGAGIVLAMPVIADSYLASGRLVPVARTIRPLGEGYALFRPVRRSGPSPVERQFVAWLRESIDRSRTAFDELTR
ncbi:LysR substrate-binding domain-containing protein [Sphingomonas sp. DT-204]|uniref:LysR substrate-binding domain-containing protein n=1 Tax=Sphingomonas sp. DT-204 TaxID=3396166 RepID=UPI003F1CF71C